MIFTYAAAKRDFYLIWHFGFKMSHVPRHTQHQDSRIKLSGVKSVASSCPASVQEMNPEPTACSSATKLSSDPTKKPL